MHDPSEVIYAVTKQDIFAAIEIKISGSFLKNTWYDYIQLRNLQTFTTRT